MSATTTHFTLERATCGRTVEGDHRLDQDEDGDERRRLSDERYYACGCWALLHEFHDGGVSRRVMRHDGKVLIDELIAGH